MALSHIQPTSPQSPTARERELKGAGTARTRDAVPGASLPTDQVVLGRQTAPVDLKRILVERVMARAEMEASSATRDLFAAAGKAEFDRRGAAFASAETSPEATANRIVEGATGYIFKAYRMRHRRLTESDLLKFRGQILHGFEAGLEDAKDIFAGLHVMTSEMDRWIVRTESLARQYLDRFFADVLASVRQACPVSQLAS